MNGSLVRPTAQSRLPTAGELADPSPAVTGAVVRAFPGPGTVVRLRAGWRPRREGTGMTATRPAARPPVPAPHRRLRLAGTLAAVGVRSALLPRADRRRRGRASVCGAARILTALGVRVVVLPPATAWPRAGGRLSVQGSAGRIGDLAVLTAVPRSVTDWDLLAERALLGRPSRDPAALPGEVLLPVSVRCRRAGEDDWLDATSVPQDLGAVLAAGGLVVEVRLLPALGTRRLPA